MSTPLKERLEKWPPIAILLFIAALFGSLVTIYSFYDKVYDAITLSAKTYKNENICINLGDKCKEGNTSLLDFISNNVGNFVKIDVTFSQNEIDDQNFGCSQFFNVISDEKNTTIPLFVDVNAEMCLVQTSIITKKDNVSNFYKHRSDKKYSLRGEYFVKLHISHSVPAFYQYTLEKKPI